MYQDDSLTLHTDLYQINMMQVYFNQGIHNKNAVFEIFFRKEPFRQLAMPFLLVCNVWLNTLKIFVLQKQTLLI